MRKALSGVRSSPPGPATPGVAARRLGFIGDDADLLEALQRGHPAAAAALHDRFGALVRRVLVRVLGHTDELDDLHQDTFLNALGAIGGVRDPAALRSWLVGVAVNTTRTWLRRRARRRWLRLWDEGEPSSDVAAREDAPPEVKEAVRRAYAVLDALRVDDRIALVLRRVDGMGLDEVARVCGVSLSTIRRRLARAEARFAKRARREPALAEWLEGGSQWRDQER